MAKKKRKLPAPAKFKVGDRVRVKHGIRDTDYTDMPLGGWAGIISEVGPIDRYRHGHQLIKLAGTNPGRKQSGKADPAMHMTRRGRGRLRALLYMSTIAAIQHNPLLGAHYDRLISRANRPLSKMAAIGACMNKLLLYAFAVMKKRQPYAFMLPGQTNTALA